MQTSLNLSNNQLLALPDDIGSLTGLEELFLQYNCLANLPVGDCMNISGHSMHTLFKFDMYAFTPKEVRCCTMEPLYYRHIEMQNSLVMSYVANTDVWKFHCTCHI